MIKMIGFASLVEKNPMLFSDYLDNFDFNESKLSFKDFESIFSNSKLNNSNFNSIDDFSIYDGFNALPSLFEPLIDQTKEISPLLQENHSFIGRFLGQPNVKKITDYKNIYVFVFGGISFAEINIITQMFKKNPNVNIKIFSETISSSTELFEI